MNRLLTAALAHAARGWHVFPLRPGDKRPAVADWQTRATTNPDRIHRWWSTRPYGIGVACGPSNLVVVDLDNPKPDSLRPWLWDIDGIHNGADVFQVLADIANDPDANVTYTVITPTGGTHLYYQHPKDGPRQRNTAGRLGWLVDTRAYGGYVVAAGTVIAGHPYTAFRDIDPQPLPDWITKQLTAGAAL